MGSKHKTRLEKYEKAFSQMRIILNDLDYLNVMPDAPDDEYDLESAQLLALRKRSSEFSEFQNAAGSIFERNFGDYPSSNFIRSLCERIWDEIDI